MSGKGRMPTPDDLFTSRCKVMIAGAFKGKNEEDPRIVGLVDDFLKMAQDRGITWSEVFLCGCEITLLGAENSFEIPDRKWEMN